MELQSSRRSSIIAKRLWNFLRITFFMMRKGLIPKKKLLMDINLFFKRGKLIRKSLSNLISHHHHNHHNHRQMMTTRGVFAQREYEFSCSNSPSNPVFFHVPSWSKRKHHHHIHLPCMNPPLVLDELESISHEEVGNIHDDDDGNYDNALALVPMTPEYAFNLRLDGYDLAPGDNRSPLISPCPSKISDYSSEEEINDGRNVEVDDEAEDFIQKFYEQLRAQSRVQLLQY